MQFSKHAELKTKQANDAAQHALSYANGLVEGAAASGEDAKTVLRVMVDAVLFPINVDTLHKVRLASPSPSGLLPQSSRLRPNRALASCFAPDRTMPPLPSRAGVLEARARAEDRHLQQEQYD